MTSEAPICPDIQLHYKMKILVCVKQVSDPEGEIGVNDAGEVIVGDSFVMNRLDEYAVEEALCICESLDSASLDAVTVGPARAESTVRRALAMGAGHAVHVDTGRELSLTSFETASLIAKAVGDRGYDLVLTGVMSEDLMAGAVGPMLAGLLDMPFASSVISWEIPADKKSIRVQREGEGGALENVELRTPALLTIQSGTKQPRYPNLTNMLRANKQTIEVLNMDDLGRPEPLMSVERLSLPEQKGRGIVLEGSIKEKAEELLSLLQERALL